MVHHLIESYDLLSNLIQINCDKVDDSVLAGFHSSDYLSFIKSEIGDEELEENDEFGLGKLSFIFKIHF